MSPELRALWQSLIERTDYERCVRPRAARFSRAPVEALLERLGRPQDACPGIHVAGSKGKGSTCAFLAAGLRAGGQRVGVYSSPHLSDWRERAQVNGAWLEDAAWEAALRAVLEASAGDETFFDLITAAAFLLFAEAGCSVQVIEVGLGGRFDSTRVFRPLASVITSIEAEHADVLGPGLERIAWNKAGILQAGVPAFVPAELTPEAAAVIASEARAVGAPLHLVQQHSTGPALEPAPQRLNFALARRVLLELDAHFPGAAAALEALPLSSLGLPGRFEGRRLPDGRPVILDVAHSENSLAAVLEGFRQRYHEEVRGVLLALRDDKDPQALAAALERRLGPRPPAESWWVCPAGDHPRSAAPDTLARAFSATALAAPHFAPGPQAWLVTGSTYLVGAVREKTTALPNG